jgi:carbon-monoxide dehydrogenase large subunit
MIGQSVRRVEDVALLTGAARYTADLAVDALDVVFVRATIAHARIRSVDTGAAAAASGVIAVHTAADFGDIHGTIPLPVPDDLVRPLMAVDRVRFCGEVIAVVVATSLASALDAAELVVVDYEPISVAHDVATALSPLAPLLFDNYPTNVALSVEVEPAAQLVSDAVFANAALVVEIDMHNQRVAVMPLETNAVLAIPDADGLTVHVSTQTPHAVRDAIAELCSLDPERVRVIARWVGGGFGAKSMAEAEYVLAARLALMLDRPVRWRQSRSENLQSVHGRAQHQTVRVAVDAAGIMHALHAELVSDNGAYPGMNHFLAGLTARMLAGPYRIESVTSNIRSVATNTAPVLGYRGAGRPEATSLIERVVDVIAAEIDLDPAELRRRNLLAADSFPYTTPTGAVYDIGDYHRALDMVLTLGHYDALRAEQATRRAAGDRVLLGIGLSTYVEVTAGAGPTEFADVEVHADGTVTVRVGTFGHGQGHRTTYAQIAADVLGVAFDAVHVIDGDTRLVARGYGTYGSRSMQVGGSAVHAASMRVVQQARALAADVLEASLDDVVGYGGLFAVAGVPARSVSWVELVARYNGSGPRDPAEPNTGIRAAVDWERPASTYPFGAHLAVVEIDTETGDVVLRDHFAVDDCGSVLNPMIVEGQVHGGIAQGAAQALYEAVVHDDAANVLTSSLAEYAMVSAAELPTFTLASCVTPTPVNPLGAKGIGESGTIGATPAVHNAVIDALAHLGVRHLDMPCTPERVWRAIRGAHLAPRVERR